MTSFADLTWNVPVPVRPAPSFLPLRQEHAPFGVVTDASAIGSFGSTGAANGDGLAAADLQTNLDANAVGRLGSGRAVFYLGKYLKGVGRTPLAANWVDPEDVYHNSGHMFASAAAREFAVSVLAQRLDFAEAIVPCEGVLVSKLDPRLDGVLARSLPDQQHRVQHPAADEALQAITVKPGQFARLSNLVWLWNTLIHATRDSFVVTAARVSYAAFTGFRVSATDGALSPPVLVAALDEAIHRAVANCLTFVANGVYWGSFHNNFTADGRFLDIELPTLTRHDFVGVAVPRDDDSRTARWSARAVNVGTEVFRYLAQARLFIRYWEQRLRWLAEWGRYLGALERRFCLGLAECLGETFTPASLAFNKELVLDHLLGHYHRRLSLSQAQRQSLEQLLTEAYLAFFHEEQPRRQWDFDRLDVELPDAEPGTQIRLFCPAFLSDVLNRPAGRWHAEWVELLRRVDSEPRPEHWLGLLRNQQRSFDQSDRDNLLGVRLHA
jgi:hypothetical protein